jgi:hypothetical protein
MSSQRIRRPLQKQPHEAGQSLNQEEVDEVAEGIGSGAYDDDFMDDVDEPLSIQRADDVDTPYGECIIPLALIADIDARKY